MYRTVGLYCINNSIDTSDIAAVENALDKIDISVRHIDGKQHIFLNGDDCTQLIRTAQIASAASAVAKIQPVRERLVDMQRKLSEGRQVIMDGRDIGTCVFPNAQLKLYLDAESGERAKRRCGELEQKGETPNFDEIKAAIEKRDYDDMHRAHSPLQKADDAIVIDTTHLNEQQVAEKIIDMVKEKL